jgi:hypothetical protein
MDTQDWVHVMYRRRTVKKDAASRWEDTDVKELAPSPSYRIHHESMQELIRKRIHMKINQDRADMLCCFPRHTFKHIESNRLLPTTQHLQKIHAVFHVSLVVVCDP